jgi:hypothetical protein
MNRIITAIAITLAPLLIASASIASPVIRADLVQAGLERAIATQAIKEHGELEKGIRDFLDAIATGATPEQASEETGIKLAVIEKLQKMAPTVKPPSKAVALVGPLASSDNPHAIANTLVRGLTVANRTKEIGYSAPLSFRVQDLVRSLRQGNPLAVAQAKAQVPQTTVDRLLQLGGE